MPLGVAAVLVWKATTPRKTLYVMLLWSCLSLVSIRFSSRLELAISPHGLANTYPMQSSYSSSFVLLFSTKRSGRFALFAAYLLPDVRSFRCTAKDERVDVAVFLSSVLFFNTVLSLSQVQHFHQTSTFCYNVPQCRFV